MPTLTEQDIDLTVYTYKEGLAARMGHDLKVRARSLACRVEVGADGSLALDATVDPRQVAVECAIVNGREDHQALSAGDKGKINGHIQDDVLDTRRHREIRFVSTRVTKSAAALDIEGQLTLTGRTRPIRLQALAKDGRYVARVRLHQPDFGIKPFSAPLGVLRIKADVEVEVSLPGELPGR